MSRSKTKKNKEFGIQKKLQPVFNFFMPRRDRNISQPLRGWGTAQTDGYHTITKLLQLPSVCQAI